MLTLFVLQLEAMTRVNHSLDCRLAAARHQMQFLQQQLAACQSACMKVTAQNEQLQSVVKSYERSLAVRAAYMALDIYSYAFTIKLHC